MPVDWGVVPEVVPGLSPCAGAYTTALSSALAVSR